MLDIALHRPKNFKGKFPIRAPLVNILGLHPWVKLAALSIWNRNVLSIQP